MNILIVSIGKRGYLIDQFRKALAGRGAVCAADANKFAPALCLADKSFVIPRADSEGYTGALLEICLQHRINGVLSINDRELPYLAAIKGELRRHGVTALISDPEVVDICFDKYKTYKFLSERAIPVPKTYLCTEAERLFSDIESSELGFPIIAKPRKGSRSVGIYVLRNKNALLNAMRATAGQQIDETEKHMFQQYIDSDQFSVHVLNGQSLKPAAVVGMVNLIRHMDGETFEIRSLKDPALLDLGVRLGMSLRHTGSASADVHKLGDTYVVLEINPRISGCYSLSHFANPNYTRNMLALLDGSPMQGDLFGFTDGLIMLKQFSVAAHTEKTIDQKVLAGHGSASCLPESTVKHEY